jgi:sterol 24-C-methyltransferase
MGLFGIDTYRLKTRAAALRSLYTLEPRDVDAFMDSYLLFDGDWSNQNGKREEQIIDYYNVLNHLCSLGTVEKMYFPPRIDPSLGVTANQDLFEQKMMRDIGAASGSRVLDIGCGRGRVANHVARHTGADVTGINIDPSQVQSATEFADRSGFASRCRFRQGSLNDPLPFEDASFDAAYEIQAFSYAKDPIAVFTEVARILEPGARFSYLDWVLLPGYDPGSIEHVDLVERACGLLGAVESPTVQDITIAMEKAGFEIVLSENPSVNGQQNQLIATEDKYFQWLRTAVKAGVKARIFPAYFAPLLDRLMLNADALITLDEMGIGTTAYHIVCEKPAI